MPHVGAVRTLHTPWWKGLAMAFKDLLVVLFGDESDGHVIATIDSLAMFAQAHVAAALLAPIPDPVFVGDVVGGGMALGEFVAAIRNDAMAAQEKIRLVLSRTNLGYEQRLVMSQTLTACDMAVTQARHVDLTIMARPSRGEGFRHEVLEAVLMESGRPLLLIPPGWTSDGAVRTVFVAWNAGREAARAVGDAGDWLAAASKIVIGTVDAKPGGPRGHGEAPGVDIATHLARHGHAVELRNIDSLGADTGEAILDAAEAAGADLIGGFGHPRLQQALFGGVTRTIVETSNVPLLMAH
jgi:nucleotide-binding universal stress UspA family protein